MRKQDFYNKAMRCIPEINCKEAYLELLKQGHEQGIFKKRTVGNEIYYDYCKITTNSSMQELF